jgi:hypothetical protein
MWIKCQWRGWPVANAVELTWLVEVCRVLFQSQCQDSNVNMQWPLPSIPQPTHPSDTHSPHILLIPAARTLCWYPQPAHWGTVLLCSFQRMSILPLPVMQQHLLVVGQSGGTSQGVSSRTGAELWCLWTKEVSPWCGPRKLPCGRKPHWLRGVWGGLLYHHAAVPALSRPWHAPFHAWHGQTE